MIKIIMEKYKTLYNQQKQTTIQVNLEQRVYLLSVMVLFIYIETSSINHGNNVLSASNE